MGKFLPIHCKFCRFSVGVDLEFVVFWVLIHHNERVVVESPAEGNIYFVFNGYPPAEG